jgi:hypothetical protein
VLTYAVLEAFTADGIAEEEVTLGLLSDYVYREVPHITERLFGVRQLPDTTIRNNFPLGVRRAGLPESIAKAISKAPTHVLIREERVRTKPEDDAPGDLELASGTLVRVVDVVGDWAVVARDGEKLGYVRASTLLRVQ